MSRIVKFFDSGIGHPSAQPIETDGIWTNDGVVPGSIRYSTNSDGISAWSTGSSSFSATTAADIGVVNHYVQAEIRDTGGGFGPIIACRLADVNNWIGLSAYTGGVFLLQRLAGSDTALYTDVFGTIVVGDTIRIECIDSNWEFFINDVSVGSGTFDSSLTSTKVGLVNGNNSQLNPWLVDFEAGIFSADVNGTAAWTWTITAPDIGHVFATGSTTFTFDGNAEGTFRANITGSTEFVFSQTGSIFGNGALAGSTTVTFSQTGSISNFLFGTGSTTLTFTPTAAISNYALARGAIALTFDLSGVASFCSDTPFKLTSGSTILNTRQTSGRTDKFCYTLS